MTKKNIHYILMIIALIWVMQSCQQPGVNAPGSEYMPDMGHSVAYEANHYNYYYLNTWGTEEEYYEYAKPRLPVKGTVPRSVGGKEGGSKPYYYEDSEEGRTLAINEMLKNPYPITDAGMAQGKELYDIFCGICHGDKGDGGGYLVRDDGGKYPVQPANFLLDEFVTASPGRYYHSIMFGKNLMGAYKDKMSYEERWQVIHYIRSLQAKEKKMTYTQIENTLNTYGQPAGENYMVAMKEEKHESGEHHHGSSHHEGEAHGETHHDEHHDNHEDHGHEEHNHNDHH